MEKVTIGGTEYQLVPIGVPGAPMSVEEGLKAFGISYEVIHLQDGQSLEEAVKGLRLLRK